MTLSTVSGHVVIVAGVLMRLTGTHSPGWGESLCNHLCHILYAHEFILICRNLFWLEQIWHSGETRQNTRSYFLRKTFFNLRKSKFSNIWIKMIFKNRRWMHIYCLAGSMCWVHLQTTKNPTSIVYHKFHFILHKLLIDQIAESAAHI